MFALCSPQLARFNSHDAKPHCETLKGWHSNVHEPRAVLRGGLFGATCRRLGSGGNHVHDPLRKAAVHGYPGTKKNEALLLRVASLFLLVVLSIATLRASAI